MVTRSAPGTRGRSNEGDDEVVETEVAGVGLDPVLAWLSRWHRGPLEVDFSRREHLIRREENLLPCRCSLEGKSRKSGAEVEVAVAAHGWHIMTFAMLIAQGGGGDDPAPQHQCLLRFTVPFSFLNDIPASYQNRVIKQKSTFMLPYLLRC